MALKVRFNPTKWARNSAASGPSYKEGVENPRVPWETGAIAGEGNFVSAMNVVLAEGLREKGIKDAGQEKYDRGIKAKALARFPQSFAAKEVIENYREGFRPFAETLEAIDLPPRGPKGQNIERVRVIQDALMAKKASL